MSILSLAWLFSGLSLLLGGSFLAVRGAGRLAESFGLSPLTRGLIPIAFAASLPELALVGWATDAKFDLPDLALGDVVGCVIANYLLALALAALALPLVVSPRMLRFAFPLGIAGALTTLAAAWTGEISATVGACLLFAAFAWPVVAILLDRREVVAQKPRKRERPKRTAPQPSDSVPNVRSQNVRLIAALSCVVGVATLVLGARWFLAYATELTDLLRVDESTWGLTVVALATTLPEAIACLALTLRGDREGAVGVAVGSSLFNLTAALGLAAIRSREGLEISPVLFEFALPIAIAAGLACVPSFYGMRRFSRVSGLVLFAFYVAFVVYAIVGENWRQAADPLEAQQARFFAMFLIAVGLIVVSSIVAILERLAQKARLADE